jgi:hypothetical protein
MVANSRTWLEQKLGPLTLWQPHAAQPADATPAATRVDITLNPTASILRLFTGFPPTITLTTPADQAKLDARAAIHARIIAQRGMPPAKPDGAANDMDTEQQRLEPAALYPSAGSSGQRSMVDRFTFHTKAGPTTGYIFDVPARPRSEPVR